MLPANDRILICPHCGAEKSVLSLASGNTFGASQWSDTKKVYPMLPQVSPVQYCPECKKYYLLSQCEQREGTGSSFERGELTFDQLKEACLQFENAELEDDQQRTLYFELLYAFNDKFNREGGLLEPSSEDAAYMKQVLQKIISLMTDPKLGIDPILEAEFLREAGCFEASLDALTRYVSEGDLLDAIAAGIKERALDQNPRAFRIQ